MSVLWCSFNMCCMCRSPLIPAVLAKLRGCYLSLAIEPVTDIHVLHIQGHLSLMMGHLSDGTSSMDPFCPVPSGWLTDSVPVFLFQRCRLITQAESVSSLWSFPLWRFLQLRGEQKSILISAHQINCTQNLILEWTWMRLKDHDRSSSDACCLRWELKLQSHLHLSNAEESPRIEFPQPLRPL